MSGNAREQITEISEGIDAEPFAGCNQSAQHRSGAPALVAAIEHPVVTTHHDGAEAALGTVVVDFQIAVLAVAQQGFPVFQGILDRVPHRTLGQHLRLFRLEIRLDVRPEWDATSPAVAPDARRAY